MNVTIVRKDKRVSHKILHAFAFAVTGGASGIVTAAEVANHAQYNARTRKLAQAAAKPAARPDAAFRAEHVPSSAEYRAAH